MLNSGRNNDFVRFFMHSEAFHKILELKQRAMPDVYLAIQSIINGDWFNSNSSTKHRFV